ncbi:MAG: hypothetical protein EHM70_19915, partial [Chloroflexota bacterium]
MLTKRSLFIFLAIFIAVGLVGVGLRAIVIQARLSHTELPAEEAHAALQAIAPLADRELPDQPVLASVVNPGDSPAAEVENEADLVVQPAVQAPDPAMPPFLLTGEDSQAVGYEEPVVHPVFPDSAGDLPPYAAPENGPEMDLLGGSPAFRGGAIGTVSGFARASGSASMGDLPLDLQRLAGLSSGFTVDLAYNLVLGMANPGDVISITNGVGGNFFGIAIADKTGFFWTPVWWTDGSGQQYDLVGSDDIHVFVQGIEQTTLTPIDATGELDVLNDQVVGQVPGLDAGTLVTVTLGRWYQYPTEQMPRVITAVDGSGNFTAAFTNNLGPHNFAQVVYPLGASHGIDYLYPANVFNLDSFYYIFGFTGVGEEVVATVYITSPTDVRWTGSGQGSWPHGAFGISDPEGMIFEPGDTIVITDSAGITASLSVGQLTASIDVDTDEVTGLSKPNAIMRVWTENPRLGTYTEVSTTADGDGNYTTDFSGQDLKNYYPVYPAYADVEGDEMLLSAAAGSIRVIPDDNTVTGSGDAPGVAYTITLQHSGSFYTQTGVTEPGLNATGKVTFPISPTANIDIQPGDVVTLETSTWSGAMTVADISAFFDTEADRITGTVDQSGWVEARVEQWNSGAYVTGGYVGISSTVVSSEFTLLPDDFDLRGGGGANLSFYDADGFATQVYFDAPQVYVWPLWGVGGVLQTPGDPVTMTLYEADGTPVYTATHNEEATPRLFWTSEIRGDMLQPGRWVTATTASGWTAGVQLPELSLTADPDDDLVWGQAPPGLVHVQAGNWNLFVPSDGNFNADTGWFGYDLSWGDWNNIGWQDPNGHLVNQTHFIPGFAVSYNVENGDNSFWGWNDFEGSPITVTIDDPYIGQTILPSFYPGNCDWCSQTDFWLPLDPGTLGPDVAVTVDFGNGYVDTVNIVDINGTPDVENDTFSGTAPAGTLNAWVQNRHGDRFEIYDIVVGDDTNLTVDFGGNGWDITYGDTFGFIYRVPGGNEVEAVIPLPYADVGMWKWNTGGQAYPG